MPRRRVRVFEEFMNPDLAAFLARNPHHCEFEEFWPIEGRMQVRLGLASELPPESVRSSILAIVTNEAGEVVFVYPDDDSGNICQILIGGRPEGGESPAETIVREAAEETGWLVAPQRIIGYRHFHQTEGPSERSDRPYPDFIQPIFTARTIRHDSETASAEDLLPWRMIAGVEVARRIPEDQHPLLMAALGR